MIKIAKPVSTFEEDSDSGYGMCFRSQSVVRPYLIISICTYGPSSVIQSYFAYYYAYLDIFAQRHLTYCYYG